MYWPTFAFLGISILAPSRERLLPLLHINKFRQFQSSLPHGSDFLCLLVKSIVFAFQSSLPHGSDRSIRLFLGRDTDFNPRSLTGATRSGTYSSGMLLISILAPSRERLKSNVITQHIKVFQSSLPHGSDRL